MLINDFPVSVIITHKGSILAKVFNTVQKDSKISSHAETNALNEVFRKYDNSFKDLNRDELALYSTFEPCKMCKGTFMHFNI